MEFINMLHINGRSYEDIYPIYGLILRNNVSSRYDMIYAYVNGFGDYDDTDDLHSKRSKWN